MRKFSAPSMNNVSSATPFVLRHSAHIAQLTKAGEMLLVFDLRNISQDMISEVLAEAVAEGYGLGELSRVVSVQVVLRPGGPRPPEGVN